MKEAFEKIIDTLQTESRYAKHCFDFKTASAFNAAITIVNIVFDDMDKGKVSDGYHTFNELYHHRAVLFAVICNTHKELAWKSKLHDTGDMYDGMFIVGIETPVGQATYHYDVEPYWDMFKVKELPKAPKWDGHSPSTAIGRISLLDVPSKNVGSNDGWIPCSVDMPKELGRYIVTLKDGRSLEAIYDNISKRFIMYEHEVIAWQPLPAPFKPKGEK